MGQENFRGYLTRPGVKCFARNVFNALNIILLPMGLRLCLCYSFCCDENIIIDPM